MKKKLKKTCRGFRRVDFRDDKGECCNIQESSAAEEPCIWLGLSDVKPQLFLPDISDRTGWIDYPMPDCVHIFSRMHLNRNNAKILVKYLNYFIKTGELPENEL